MKRQNKSSPKNNTCSGNLASRAFPPESENFGIDLEIKNVHRYVKFNYTLNIILKI